MPNAISVVFITYNRADLLEKTFSALRSAILVAGIDAEYIVTDDASDQFHSKIIDRLPFDKKLVAPRNEGLGANTNKGLSAASNEIILQIQDDCEFVGAPSKLAEALRILEEDDRVGIVQLASAMTAEIQEECFLGQDIKYVLFQNDHRDVIRECGLRPYSDQPHLKRRQFCQDVGPYLEGVPMTTMELEYQRRVANQNRWFVAAMGNGKGLFTHLGGKRTFNASVLRARRIARMEAIPVFGKIMHLRRLGRVIRDSLRARFSGSVGDKR